MPDSFDFSQQRVQSDTKQRDFVPVITYVVIAICLVMTFAFLTAKPGTNDILGRLAAAGSPDANSIWSGNYFLLLTSVFVHLSIPHIVFNMIWFYQLGSTMEKSLGSVNFLLFFLISGLVSSGAQLAVEGNPGAGASGVVYALFALMWAGRLRYPEWRVYATRQNLNVFVIWGLFCVFATWANAMRVANAAHFGGMFFGFAFGYLFIANKYKWPSVGVLVILVCLTAFSFTWLPWNGGWTWWKGSHEMGLMHYDKAVYWYKRSMALGEDKGKLWYNIAKAEDLQGHDALAAEAAQNSIKNGYRSEPVPEIPDSSQPDGKGPP
ncbi:MAG: rhomboid family intramembrane serine protease [Chthonomonadales bacterium]